jgi:hypothetical protein
VEKNKLLNVYRSKVIAINVFVERVAKCISASFVVTCIETRISFTVSARTQGFGKYEQISIDIGMPCGGIPHF